jgi:hypothetical protein
LGIKKDAKFRVSTIIGAKSASNFGKPERIAKENKTHRIAKEKLLALSS